MTKSFEIPKQLVWEAYRRIKANAGSAGIDGESLNDYESNLKNNLYTLWNRMCSGSYFPKATKTVAIAKKSGGKRNLGIPTVADRIAQMVVKLKLEPEIDPYFSEDSYGYRARRSAIDAISITRKRCWQQDWVIEYDIKGLFDNIPHDLLQKALTRHTECKWCLLYITRWLKAPMQDVNGDLKLRDVGTPQGGVISPLLANLFLHYAIDKWIEKKYPSIKMCRYADDGLLHCQSECQAKYILQDLGARLKECGLELHPDKTKIVYCKDGRRRKRYENTSFTFLGYTFKPRVVCNRHTKHRFVSFTPAVSKSAQKAKRDRIRKASWRRRTEIELEDISQEFNSILRGWLNYYGKYHRSELNSVWRHFNRTLIKWAMKKYKRHKKSRTKAGMSLERIAKENPTLFIHWQRGIKGAFA